MNRHAWPGSSRADLVPAVPGVIGIAVDVDRHSGRAGDVDGFGGAFLRAQPAREDGALPRLPRPGNDVCGHVRRQDRVDTDDPAPGARLEYRYGGHRRRPAAPGRMPKRRRHRLVRGQVERVYHRRLQRRREPDGGRVEGVIVDHVIPDLLHAAIGAGESRLGRRWLGPAGLDPAGPDWPEAR